MSFDAPLLRIRAAVRILKGEFQMKQYQKPEIFYENFVLAEHIAQCRYTMNAQQVETCSIIRDNRPDGFDFTGTFVESNKSCIYHGLDEYCYTNSTSEFVLFMS